jgi:hypothetical protein
MLPQRGMHALERNWLMTTQHTSSPRTVGAAAARQYWICCACSFVMESVESAVPVDLACRTCCTFSAEFVAFATNWGHAWPAVILLWSAMHRARQ